MKNLPTLLLLLLCIACKDVPEQTAQIKENPYADLDAELDSLFATSEIVGMSTAVFNGNEILFEKGYGFRSLKDSLEYTVNTTQNIASISKLVTGLTLLKAMENTSLTLSDDVNRFAPFSVRNPMFPDTPITLGQLVTHTSSISDGEFYDKAYYLLENDAATNPEIDLDVDVFIEKEDALSLTNYLKTTLTEQDSTSSAYGYIPYKPGSTYNYSNHGAALIALIIENITGKSFVEFSQEEIIDKLALTTSTWENTIEDPHSKLYSTGELRVPFYGLVTAADGAYRTSAHELAILGQELIKGFKGNGTLLGKEGYQMFYKKQLDSTHFKTEKSMANHADFGFNKGVFITYDRLGIGHSGGDPGVTTLLYFNPETDKGFLILVNTELQKENQVTAFKKMARLLNQEIEKPLKSNMQS